MIKVGVIGCGYWGPKLIRNFNDVEGFETVAVSDLDQNRLDLIKDKYPPVETTTDSERLIEDPQINALAIATPISTHYELAKKALLNSKHVLVEKPLAVTEEQVKNLNNLARKQKRILMVDSTFLFTPQVQKIKELIGEGELGDIFYIDSARENLGNLDGMGRATGFYPDINVLYDLAPHDLSIINFLIDEEPVSVSCFGKCYVSYNQGNHETSAYGNIEFENGTTGHFHVSWLVPEQVKRTTIVGSKKMILYDDLAKDLVKVYDKGVEVDDTGGERNLVKYREGEHYTPQINNKEALTTEVEHFLDCIQTGREPITNGQAELRVVRILEAAQESMKSGGKIIEL